MILISLLRKIWLTKAIQFGTLDDSRQRPMKSLSSVCRQKTYKKTYNVFIS